MVLWLLGSLKDRSLAEVGFAAPFMLAGWVLLLSSGRALDALTLGEDTGKSLGLNLAWLRARVIGGVTLAVGSAVAVSGSIGFVGLVVPHLLRPWVGYQPGLLLGPSALGGAALVLLADLCIRWLSGSTELMLGVVTALIGAPFFFYLVLVMRRTVQ
jgi:iron complex transport system permease protein